MNTNSDSVHTSVEVRCSCPQKYGPYVPDDDERFTSVYSAICLASYLTLYYSSNYQSWASTKTCPKGWGKGVMFKSGTVDYVINSRGYELNSTDKYPVYDYVTRYTTKYYNYIGSRVAKS